MKGNFNVEIKSTSQKFNAFAVKNTKVGKSGNKSGRLYTPREWIGKKVAILLLEPVSEE